MFSSTKKGKNNETVARFFARLRTLLFGSQERPQFDGVARGIAGTTKGQTFETRASRLYDNEYPESSVRDHERAKILIGMREGSPEVGAAIRRIKIDALFSVDGDDSGIRIPSTDREGKEVYPITLDIARANLTRLWTMEIFDKVLDNLMSFGDYFIERKFNFGKNPLVEAIQVLPTWEIFVVDNGQDLWYEQRRHLSDENPNLFPELQIIHGRYDRRGLYGRALFEQSAKDHMNLEDLAEDVAAASRQIGFNPTLHIMAEEGGKVARDAYKKAHEKKLREGAISHYYLAHDMDMRKLSQQNPDLSKMISVADFWRNRMVMSSHVPRYLMGMESNSAQDLQGQPAMGYARFIANLRRILSASVRQTIDIDLALKNIPEEKRNYQLVWPRIAVNVFEDTPQNESGPNQNDKPEDGEGE